MNRRLPPHVAAYPGSVLRNIPIHGGIGRVAALARDISGDDSHDDITQCRMLRPSGRICGCRFIPGVICFTNW